MKKKILIINKSFELGGIQSSMVNMANELSEQYEVHLFLYNPEGVLKTRLKDDVRILNSSWRFKCLGMHLGEVLNSGNPKMIAFRLFAGIWSRLFGNELPINIAINHQPKMGFYDLVIAYHQEQRKKTSTSGFARVADKCTDGAKKVAWVHFDCNTVDLDSEYNNVFYKKLDNVVCVSSSLMNCFSDKYPELKEKMRYCYNFLPYNSIKVRSMEKQSVEYPKNSLICFSACRLAGEKAIVRAINAMAETLKKHGDIVWFIAGEGSEKKNIEDTIEKNGLAEYVRLIGNQSNPYSYMKNADLVLNVSYHEAAPMVFFESMALGTPVLATKTSSAEELLGGTGASFICENSERGIKAMFASLCENRDLISEAARRLEYYVPSNDESASQIERMLAD